MYDVIVIGNDTSSLTAAAKAAQLGFKTALLSDKSLPDRLTLSGYAFDLDPFPWPAIKGLDESPLLSDILFDGQPGENSPGIQIVLPEHRVDLVPGKYAQIKELLRECPDASLHFDKFFNLMDDIHSTCETAVSASGRSGPVRNGMRFLLKMIRYRIFWSLYMQKLKDTTFLQEIFNAQFGILSGNISNGRVRPTAAYVLALPWKGIPFYGGDKGNFREALRAALKDFGGDIINGSDIQKLLLGKEIDVVLRTPDGEVMVSGRNLIMSTKCEDLFQIEHDRRVSKWLSRKNKSTGDVLFPFTIHMGVSDRAIPDLMKAYVALVPEENSYPGAYPLILLNASAHGDLNRAPDGKRALSATVFLSTSPIDVEDVELKQISGAILTNIEMLLPFLREHIDCMDLDQSIAFSRQSVKVVNPRKTMKQSLLQRVLFPDSRPKNNVILTGGETYSEFGFAGEILSGIHASNRISGGRLHGSK